MTSKTVQTPRNPLPIGGREARQQPRPGREDLLAYTSNVSGHGSLAEGNVATEHRNAIVVPETGIKSSDKCRSRWALVHLDAHYHATHNAPLPLRPLL